MSGSYIKGQGGYVPFFFFK